MPSKVCALIHQVARIAAAVTLRIGRRKRSLADAAQPCSAVIAARPLLFFSVAPIARCFSSRPRKCKGIVI
jgi:hypothetical protein